MTAPNVCWSSRGGERARLPPGERAHADMRKHLEKLRADAAERALIRDLATDLQNASYSRDWPSIYRLWLAR
jgi:hypothetical protein